MSSYFDKMAVCLNDPVRFVDLVRGQYRWYLHEVNQECWRADLGKVNAIIDRFEHIQFDFLDPGLTLQEYHSLAHDLARANIRLRGGRRAMDNPPIPY